MIENNPTNVDRARFKLSKHKKGMDHGHNM